MAPIGGDVAFRDTRSQLVDQCIRTVIVFACKDLEKEDAWRGSVAGVLGSMSCSERHSKVMALQDSSGSSISRKMAAASSVILTALSLR